MHHNNGRKLANEKWINQVRLLIRFQLAINSTCNVHIHTWKWSPSSHFLIFQEFVLCLNDLCRNITWKLLPEIMYSCHFTAIVLLYCLSPAKYTRKLKCYTLNQQVNIFLRIAVLHMWHSYQLAAILLKWRIECFPQSRTSLCIKSFYILYLLLFLKIINSFNRIT